MGDLPGGFGTSAAWNQTGSGAGLQVALVNEAEADFAGVQLGVCNWGGSKAIKPAELSALGSLGPQSIIGIIRNIGRHRGVEDMRGLQLGLVNKAADMYGLQCGILWNDAHCARGLQLGLVNVADTMTGVQIGLVNIINEAAAPFIPFINAHF